PARFGRSATTTITAPVLTASDLSPRIATANSSSCSRTPIVRACRLSMNATCRSSVRRSASPSVSTPPGGKISMIGAPSRRRTARGTREPAQPPGADLIDPGATLDGQDALHCAFHGHLRREEGGVHPGLCHAEGHGEREGRLAHTDLATEYHQISAADSAAE